MEFIGEQDGPSEQELKRRWKVILSHHPEVERAYLALAAYNRGESQHPVLCIQSSREEDVRLVDELAAPFKDIFSPDCALGIIFLSKQREEQVRRVCHAFHEAI